MTLYEILEVSEIASVDVIKIAYETLLKKYQYDIQDDDFYCEKIKQLDNAFFVLSSPEKRMEYDNYLKFKRLENVKNESNSQILKPVGQTRKSKRYDFSKIKTIDLVVVFLVLLLILVVIYPADSTGDSNEKTTNNSFSYHTTTASIPLPKTEPINGTFLMGQQYYGGNRLTVIASPYSSHVVKLKNTEKKDVLSFYVRAGETVSVSVPNGLFYVYFASGNKWYGDDWLFGEHTSYSMDPDLQDFENYSLTYTLYESTNGNFKEKTIDEEEFF